jgi:hypothetical protein
MMLDIAGIGLEVREKALLGRRPAPLAILNVPAMVVGRP